MSKKSILNNKVKRLEGMNDISPERSMWWKIIQKAGEEIADLHHFHYIDTPIVENAELFEKVLNKGESINKNFFVFKAGTTTKMILRPFFLASVMRSYLENQLGSFASPLKTYTHGSVFLKNKKGKQRQFRKFGFQIIRGNSSIYDMQIIIMVIDFLNKLKIKKPVLKVNVMGCKEDRLVFKKELKKYYKFHKDEICRNCQKKYGENIIDLLKCNKNKCLKIKKGAPNILDYLCKNCEMYFQDILEFIEDNDINYVPDPYLFSNRDYNNKFIFEIYPEKNYKEPIISGGRADYLSGRIGGPKKLNAIEAIINMDTLVKYLEKNVFLTKVKRNKKRIFFIAIGNKAKKSSVVLMNKFRNKGVIVIESIGKNTLESQLKIAKRSDANLVLIYGQKEFFENTIMMRDIDSGSQENIPLEKMINEVKKRLKKR